jgi:hypothetical protein
MDNLGKQQVWIKRLSKSKQLKLIRGGAIRISHGDEQVLNLPEKMAKVIMSKFAKQKSHTLKGEGMYDDFKAGLGKVAKIAKPYAQQAFGSAVDYGTPAAQAAAKAAIATGTTALSAVQPELAPFLIPAGMAAGAMSDSVVRGLGQYAKKLAGADSASMAEAADSNAYSPMDVSAYSSHPMYQYAQQSAMQHPAVARAMETMQQYHPSQLPEFHQMSPQLPLHNYAPQSDLTARASNIAGLQMAANQAKVVHHRNTTKAKHVVEHAKVHHAVGEMKKKSRQKGKGLYAGAQHGSGMMRPDRGIVGHGGGMVSPFGDHPALESDPLGANFASRAFRMPSSAALIR